MMKFDETLTKFVKADLESAAVPMLVGEPGIGKSSWVEALAQIMHTEAFHIACNELYDKADLTGARLVPIGKNPATGEEQYAQKFFPHYDIMTAIKYAEEHPTELPILFLDEINRTSADVTSACLSLATARKIGSIKLPDNLRLILAGNDKGNINVLDTASISRTVVYHVAPDRDTFFAVNPDLNVYIKNVLTAHPETLMCLMNQAKTPRQDAGSQSVGSDDDDAELEEILDMDNEMVQFTTPRTITNLSNWLNKFTNQELLEMTSVQYMTEDNVPTTALAEVVEAHVGNTTFTALLMDEIGRGIMTVNNQQNVISVPKPAIYDQMKACANRTDLQTMVQSMSDRDKSGCLVYALYEDVDNSLYISTLAHAMTVLDPADTQTLIRLTSQHMLNRENAEAMLGTNTPLSDNLNILLSAGI